jgi:hypothetical protein
VFCDIDGDSVKELGLALLDTTKATSAISFFEMDTKDFSAVGSLSLDGSVISYANITAAPITSQSMGVYLDAYKGTDSLITELIYMKDGKLYNPFAGNQDNTNIATLRYCSLTSTDINKDGVVEIPFMERLPGYAQEDEILGHHLICWRYFNGNISDTALTWWYNGAEGYYLEIDTAWQGKISVVYDEKDKPVLEEIIKELNILRLEYIDKETPASEKKIILRRAKQILPEGFLQRRTVDTNYEELRTIYFQRRTHRLPEWEWFCEEIKKLPYFEELFLTE